MAAAPFQSCPGTAGACPARTEGRVPGEATPSPVTAPPGSRAGSASCVSTPPRMAAARSQQACRRLRFLSPGGSGLPLACSPKEKGLLGFKQLVYVATQCSSNTRSYYCLDNVSSHLLGIFWIPLAHSPKHHFGHRLHIVQNKKGLLGFKQLIYVATRLSSNTRSSSCLDCVSSHLLEIFGECCKCKVSTSFSLWMIN